MSRLGKRMVFFVGVSALVFILAGVVYYRSIDALFFAFGVILTSALNVLKVYMLENTARKTLDIEDQKEGKNFVRFQYLIRYFLTAAVLLGVGLIHMYADPPFINIWGAVFGIFTLQISVIIVRSMKIADE